MTNHTKDPNDDENGIDVVEEARRAAIFNNLERDFFEYVLTHSEELLSQTKPAYIRNEFKGKVTYKPPKYIRWVGKLQVNDSEFLRRLAELKAAYAYAMHEHFTGSYPRRFVRYYKEVEYMTSSTNEAYKSWRLKGLERGGDFKGFVPMKVISLANYGKEGTEKAYDRLYHEARELTVIGLEAKAHMRAVMGVPMSLELLVKEKALYTFFETDHIQAREHTGTQYRARLRHVGDSKGERIPLGFIVIDKDSPIDRVDYSLPQAERPHTLAKLEKMLRWPSEISELNYLLFDKS